ncbi:hypothetical protein EDB85DRAFT_1991734 [Lactarius pseudohatsudake]|nr:hypothetical protein EDB85DRAFT_1991734 [Lactarius pseudohatsudake]
MDGLCIQMAPLLLAIPCMRPCCGVHPLPALFVPCPRGVLPPDCLPAARVFSCESTGGGIVKEVTAQPIRWGSFLPP